MLPYLLSGLLGVSNMILWGVYGDLLAEDFSALKIVRSIMLGIIWSLFLFYINPELPLVIVALSVISLERISTEIYKAFLRSEDQRKYAIPSDLRIRLNRGIKSNCHFRKYT